MAKDFLTHWHENDAHNIIINYDFLNTSKRLQKTQSQSKVQCQNQEKQKKKAFVLYACEAMLPSLICFPFAADKA